MNSNQIQIHATQIFFILFTLVTISLLFTACSDPPETVLGPDPGVQGTMTKENAGIQRAMDVQNRNTERFLAINGVVGTGTGLTENGEPAMIIFTERAIGPGEIPAEIEGIPVIEEVVGVVEPLSYGGQPTASKRANPGLATTDRWTRPVPIGIATSNWNDCASATIGVRVRRGDSVFVLSNNHVFGRLNAAGVGELILQPGRSDDSCAQTLSNEVARVADVHQIVFSTAYDNLMDAALASTSTSLIGNSTPGDGYGTPSSTTTTAYIGMKVQKYGRSSQLTQGKISAINVSIGINYWCGTARFVDQLAIQPERKNAEFAIAGDSGSLIVVADTSAQPVGLLFGKSVSTVFATPIGTILNRFNVTIDGK